jgi:hypothetical protein
MRCPYCGGLNQERAAFCVNCGRDLTRPVPANVQHQPYQPARPGTVPQSRPANAPNQPQQRVPSQQTQQQQGYTPAQRPVVAQPLQAQAAAPANRRHTAAPGPIQAPANPLQPAPLPSAPEPPAPFPPRTLAQFEALLAGCNQAYTVVENRVGDGKKQILRIAYPRCTGWQQAATLLKALQEQQNTKCDTILIQGVLPQQADVNAFSQGQLQFDRNARLGGQVGNRYIVETGNGFASDAVRFVLNG